MTVLVVMLGVCTIRSGIATNDSTGATAENSGDNSMSGSTALTFDELQIINGTIKKRM